MVFFVNWNLFTELFTITRKKIIDPNDTSSKIYLFFINQSIPQLDNNKSKILIIKHTKFLIG